MYHMAKLRASPPHEVALPSVAAVVSFFQAPILPDSLPALVCLLASIVAVAEGADDDLGGAKPCPGRHSLAVRLSPPTLSVISSMYAIGWWRCQLS